MRFKERIQFGAASKCSVNFDYWNTKFAAIIKGFQKSNWALYCRVHFHFDKHQNVLCMVRTSLLTANNKICEVCKTLYHRCVRAVSELAVSSLGLSSFPFEPHTRRPESSSRPAAIRTLSPIGIHAQGSMGGMGTLVRPGGWRLRGGA